MEEAEDIPVETQANTPSTPVEGVQAQVDEEMPLQDVPEPQPEEEPQPPPRVIPRRSQCVVRQPERWLGLHEVTSLDTDDPVSFDDAMSRADSDSWLEAMKAEIQSMYDNQVWDMVDLPPGFRPIENKWVFKRKSDKDGNLTTYKARLVAKGYRQI